MPSISVVVINWNAREELGACLASLAGQSDRDFETIVVDNGSNDGSAELARARYGWARVIETGANLGFAHACNAGIEASRGEWVATLNNDAEASAGWIAALKWAAGQGMDGLGMLQSRILFPGDRPRLNSTGILLFRDGFSVDRDYGTEAARLKPCAGGDEVFCPTAAAALYRRQMLDEVRLPSGYFDRDYFMYVEDVDLGWRCRLAGWRAWYVPDALVVHGAHASASRRGRHFTRVQCKKNHVRTVVKNASPRFLARALAVTSLNWVRIPLMAGPGQLLDLLRGLPRARAQRALVSQMCKVPREEVERQWARPTRERG